jgi:hypothetical protein
MRSFLRTNGPRSLKPLLCWKLLMVFPPKPALPIYQATRARRAHRSATGGQFHVKSVGELSLCLFPLWSDLTPAPLAAFAARKLERMPRGLSAAGLLELTQNNDGRRVRI